MTLKEIIEDTLDFTELFGFDCKGLKHYSEKQYQEKIHQYMVDKDYAKWSKTATATSGGKIYTLFPTDKGRILAKFGNELLFHYSLENLNDLNRN